MNTKKTNILKFIFCILFVSQSYVAKSQAPSCDLEEFQAKYNKGHFEEVNKDLRDCLEVFKGNEANYIDALRLLTMNSIMLDKDNQAVALEDVDQLLNTNSDYNFRSNDPYEFKELVKEYRNFGGLKVTSVSKFEETLDEAPATIYVITAKDIENRGYLDIEQIFHDIPGFSISRSNGPAYSLLYPRGYRSTLNDKFLLLIDGIEENDLNSDNAVINRQIPLSNIKQIEVIYGPSSTMYGANAFSAVINIITKNPEFDKGNDFSADIQTNYGTWKTNFVDATVSKKLKNGFIISVTGRLFHSDEMDLTDEGFFDTSYYLDTTRTLKKDSAIEFIKSNQNDDKTGYFDYDTTAGQELVRLTQAGANRMQMLDNVFYTNNRNLGFKFNNRVDNWFVNTKLKFNELTIGIETFKSNTGALPWYPHRIASPNLSRWITLNSSVYIRYEKKINQNLFLTNLTSYRLHTLDGNTNLPDVKTYRNGKLKFQDLLNNSLPKFDSLYYYRTSNQLRNELKLFYKKNNFNLVTGLEFRQGIFQMDYLTGDKPNPHENIPKTTKVGIKGGNQSNKLDIGYFVQGKYSFLENFSATLGGRVDYNRVRSSGGYGFVFNPRVALVYSKKEKFTFKAIYSEAFKDPSFLTKYGTTDTRIANPTLKPEKVKNFEVSAIIKPIKDKDLNIEVNAFNSLYSNVVAEKPVDDGSALTKNQASGKGNNIKGIQATLSYTYNIFNFWANYTYLNPKGYEEKPDLDSGNEGKVTYEYKRISDIPSSSANVGFNLAASKKLNINLRANYVGKRKTGKQTLESKNPLDEINAYFTAHTNVNYELFERLKIGILINNIFNQKYYHPGVRSANEKTNSSKSLQNARSIMFRAKYKF